MKFLGSKSATRFAIVLLTIELNQCHRYIQSKCQCSFSSISIYSIVDTVFERYRIMMLVNYTAVQNLVFEDYLKKVQIQLLSDKFLRVTVGFTHMQINEKASM